jgi:predicted ATP-grasp superfamily ATP-dependent carboligase
MTEEQLKKEDQLFIHLVNTFVQSAWISLGKVKNPVSDKMERNLDQATYYIDLLDMLQTKMKGNLSEWEEQFIIHSLSELKLNFIDEQKKSSEEEKIDKGKESTPPVKKEEPKVKKKAKSSKKSSKSKKEK